MSQDLLAPVSLPPELAKLVGLGAKGPDKTAEKPAQDFMAVLDRALTERPAAAGTDAAGGLREPERPAEPPRPESARPDQGRPENPETSPRQDTGRAQTVETSAPTAAEAARAAQAASDALGSHRLEKYRARRDGAERASETVTAKRGGPALPLGAAESRAQPAQAAEPVGRQPATKAGSPILQGVESVGGDAAAAVSRKVGKKTAAADTASPAIPGAQAVPGNQVAAAAKGAADAARAAAGNGTEAAARMRTAAKADPAPNLQDALAMVRDLADKLGVAAKADPARTDAVQPRVIEFSRNAAVAVRPAGREAKAEAADKTDNPAGRRETVSLRGNRAESLRTERRDAREGKEAVAALDKAAGQGRVQVLDAAQARSSLVLESLLAERGGAARPEEGARKDGPTLVNTAFFAPAAERSTATIPVHLVAGQQGNLAQALRSHLAERGNGDIVQQARIVMNGKENGEIKLILKPESLGEVRIHLQMQEGHIAGTIFVDNKDVQQVFQDNLSDLLAAFREGGLDASGLQVAVDSRGPGSGQSGFGDGSQDSNGARTAQAVRSIERNVATVTVEQPRGQVDLVV